ncbi:pantoate--beta-alanine ligase [Algivirga pacifica]|uniref:Pantothenate synthetase n=1 Tax=Algivirga pacifica TaxID=1162670 RepID=A0ABP9D922_9BACT
MKIFRDKNLLQQYILQAKANGQSIGFVPTMGTLHQGHLSLIKQSKKANDLTFCSIFVNPTQFNNPEDLATYPRQEASDIEKLTAAGCDAVFIPDNQTMYPTGLDTSKLLQFNFGILEQQLEGAHRPGHFNGVGIVVSKLFHLVSPDNAYFGLKDLQQFLIIRKMVRDLSFPLQVHGCPTVRESDGLAMSSRNLKLSTEERQIAPSLHEGLTLVQQAILSGESVQNALQKGLAHIEQSKVFTVEYLEVRETETLTKVDNVSSLPEYAILVAAHLGNVRLIDNLLVQQS